MRSLAGGCGALTGLPDQERLRRDDCGIFSESIQFNALRFLGEQSPLMIGESQTLLPCNSLSTRTSSWM